MCKTVYVAGHARAGTGAMVMNATNIAGQSGDMEEALYIEHISDDLLARYSKGTLGDANMAEVEEHLLICEQCCDRLTKLDDEWGLNG
jgi:hypothetical protein